MADRCLMLAAEKAIARASSNGAAQATIWGLEFETQIRPSDALTLNGSLAYLNADYDSFIEDGVDVSDNRAFPHTPKWSASLGADWRVIEGDWGQFNLIGDMSIVSDYFTFPYALEAPASTGGQFAGDTESPGRVIVNMSAVVSDIELGGAQAKVTAWVRNLTKEDNPTNFIDFGPAFGGLLLGYFPDPRTYGVTVGVEF